MSLRGAASIIGIGELKPERRKPGRTGPGLAQEVAKLCIDDSGLLKEDVDGLITEIPFSNSCEFAEVLGIQPTWSHGVNMMGSSGPTTVALAAMAINAGLANNVLCLVTSGEFGGFGGGRGDAVGGQFPQWAGPFGPGPGANFWYALVANRYQHEFGLTDEERVAVAVAQRENAQANPEAAFYGTPATTDDILNSRMVANPLTLLECVMPTIGAAALMVSRPEAAEYSPHDPVYLLGVGHSMDRGVPGITYVDRMTKSPVEVSARAAYKMAGIGPQDMDIRLALRLLHDHGDHRVRGRRLRAQGRRRRIHRRERRHLQERRDRDQHPRRAALVRPAGHGRGDVARHGGRSPADGARARVARKRTSTTASSTAEVAD